MRIPTSQDYPAEIQVQEHHIAKSLFKMTREHDLLWVIAPKTTLDEITNYTQVVFKEDGFLMARPRIKYLDEEPVPWVCLANEKNLLVFAEKDNVYILVWGEVCGRDGQPAPEMQKDLHNLYHAARQSIDGVRVPLWRALTKTMAEVKNW